MLQKWGYKMENVMVKKIKCELYNDNFQNFKRYNIPKAQLVIADIPYNVVITFTGVVRCGITAEIIKTVKVS